MSDYPECENCAFFRMHETYAERKCTRHDIVLPRIDWQMICVDWQNGEHRIDAGHLEPGILYYYSYGTGDIIDSRLADFGRLRNMLISVTVRQDKELGWVIYPRNHRRYFPAAGKMLTVMVGDRKSKFYAVDAERTLVSKMMPGEAGWETVYHNKSVYMLHSLESSELLYHWFSSFMDCDRYIDESFAPNLFAFMEIVEQDRMYALHPDLLLYNKYLYREPR